MDKRKSSQSTLLSTYIVVDEDHSVNVSNYGNHRVIKWAKGAQEGIVVAGGERDENSVA